MRFSNHGFRLFDPYSLLRPFFLYLQKIPRNHLRFFTSVASSNPHPHTISHSGAHLSFLRNPEQHFISFYIRSNNTVASNLADLPLEPSQIPEALYVFDEIPQPNPISWNFSQLSSALRSFGQSGQFYSVLRIFNNMRSGGFRPDQFTYVSAISACTASQNVKLGDQFLCLVLKVGFLSNEYVLSGLLDLFSKVGCFIRALQVFSESCNANVVCWNAIIAGAVRNGEYSIASELFHEMVGGFCMPNGFTFSSVLSFCAAALDLDVGRGIHAWVLKFNEQDDVFVGTALVDLYSKCGNMEAAVKVFSSMPVLNVVSWTAIISGFVQTDDGSSAVNFFKKMMISTMNVNKYTITSVLFACAKCFMASVSYQIHGWIFKSGLYTDPVVKDALISTYARTGNIHMSEKVFEDNGTDIQLSNWSAMISGLVENQCLGRSVQLLWKMFQEDLKPDKKCISCILSIVNCITLGEQLHSYVLKVGLLYDVLVCSSLFTMYSKCGCIGDSYELFGQMPEKDRVAWTSMILGLATHRHAEEAFQLFREMILKGVKPDEMTLSSVLTACYDPMFMKWGKEIHGFALHHGLFSDTIIGSSLMSMYSKCKKIAFTRRVFNQIHRKDKILWSSLISAYSSNDYSEEAIFEFHQMATGGFEIDHITSSSVLAACANLSRPILGRQLHAQAIKAGIILHNSVASALVTMYSNCGIISDSRKIFDSIQNPDLVTWTTMIEGYAQHGKAKEAHEVFGAMKNKGIRPDSVTCSSILSACSHNGMVDEGFDFFSSMRIDYEIEPEMHHYACIVDLLGRAGRLKEALDLIERMPIEPDLLVWSTLLAACRFFGDVEVGSIARKKVLDLEPHDSGSYIAASNMSADMGEWDQVVRIRSSMRGVGMKKEPGWSAL